MKFSCASYMGKEKYEIKEKVFYTQALNERQMGAIFIPKKNGPLPGVILIHGGGWNSRSYEDMNSVAKSLASHGYTVFNINYRFAPKDLHPAPINDLTLAMDYFKAHASELKLDPSRIALWGYSAGGHIASYYALTNSNSSSNVQAVVSGGAPYDFTWYPYSPIIKKYMGDYRDKCLNAYIEASPVFKITESAPPFFLYHAIEDKLVEFAQSTSFEARLKTFNIPVERHQVSWWGHATTFIFSNASVKKGIQFLEKHL